MTGPASFARVPPDQLHVLPIPAGLPSA